MLAKWSSSSTKKKLGMDTSFMNSLDEVDVVPLLIKRNSSANVLLYHYFFPFYITEQEGQLVALIPMKDKRLKPRRT